ncbi:SMEK domain-containing protein [Paenibacillus sp. IHB B 3415]|uniref:SMEK domain-containing protein n=1 Tax=Paenibacillus sp. IHB B 3415 TaxID=867080 RepID=UPI00069BCD41|nr:SMEK domain-containing protein [Paenibacillus sp. IHB B 3415]
MNRTKYYNYIDEKLMLLSARISVRGKQNILDLHIHSEMFFAGLLNLLFDYKFVNLNTIKRNVEGIDLVDTEKEIIAQVSSTCSRQKIENSLNKEILTNYPGYTFKFIVIANDATSLRNKDDFANPYGISFTPADDIIDIVQILNIVLHKSIDEQKKVYSYIRKELGTEIEDDDFVQIIDSHVSVLAEDIEDSFVKTTIFETGLDALKNSNILIMDGESGIGKTSTAISIAYTLSKEYNECKLMSIDGSDKLESKKIEELLVKLKKSIREQEVIIIDDFLGKTKLNESEDYFVQIEELLKFIKQCKTKKIILTTRTTIFENSKKHNESLAQFYKYDTKVLTITDGYSVDDRINILVKYILRNDIRDKVGDLLNDKKILHMIIKHQNFSPLIIERATSDCRSKESNQFGEIIFMYLENPAFIWEKEVGALDDNALNYLFVLYSLSDTYIEQKYIDECFGNFNKIMGIKKIENFNDTKERLKALLSFDNTNKISFRHPSIIDYLSKKIYPRKDDLISSAVYFEQIERLDENKEKIIKLLIDPQKFFKLKVLPFRFSNEDILFPNNIGIPYLKCILECNFQNKEHENIIIEVMELIFQRGHLLLMWTSDVVIDILNFQYYNMSAIINNENYMELIYRASNSNNVWKLIQLTEEKNEKGYDFSIMKKYVQNEILSKLADSATAVCEEQIMENFESYIEHRIDDYFDDDDYEEIACEIINDIIDDIDAEHIGLESMKEAAGKIGLYNVDFNNVSYDLYYYETLVEDYAINAIEEYLLYK